MTAERLVADFDHLDPDFDPDVACTVHKGLRERARVGHSAAHGGMWVLSHYDDVRAALTDHRTFASGSGVFHPRAPHTPMFAPIEYDPPRHGVFRDLMKEPLSRKAVERLRPRIDELVAGLIAPIAERGKGDFVAELALPLPLSAVGAAVGFSAEAQRRFRELTSATWQSLSQDDGGTWPRFTAVFDAEIARARDEPGEDYLSRLVRAEIDGRPVTDHELHVMLVSWAGAGHETTMNTMAHLLWHLARHPELQDELRARPDLRPAAVEETLRLYTPDDHLTRRTTRDVEVGGETIPCGARVMLVAGAADKDPARFPDPEEFRLDRGPARHLAFGQGIHFCLGAHLARAVLVSVLTELARHPDYVLVETPRRFYENGRHACLDRLMVRFEAR